MKKLTVVALALTAAFQAHAVEVYKNDTTTLDLYGRIYAGQFFGDKKEGVDSTHPNGTQEYSDKQGANQFVRFGAKVDSQINSQLKALAQYEVELRQPAHPSGVRRCWRRLGQHHLRSPERGPWLPG